MNNLKHYKNYKSSGIAWLGDIPEHWEVIKLTGMCSFVRGNSSFKKDELLSEGKYVALQYGKTYKVNEVDKRYQFYVNDEFYKVSQIVNYGEVIFISTSETIEDLGHSVFYNRSDLGLLGGEQMLLKPKRDLVNGKYLYYSSKIFAKELKKYATGVKVFRFNISDLKTIYTSIPPLSEQTAIANFLDYKISKIDRFIAKKKRLIKLLNEQKSAIINDAVTKGLNPNVKMKPSGIEWLGDIPEHWEVRKLKYVAKIINGFAFKTESFTDNGVKVIKITNIQPMCIDWESVSYVNSTFYSELNNFRLFKGDLVIALTRPIIKAGIKAAFIDREDKLLLNQRNAVIRVNSLMLNRSWLYFIIVNKKFVQRFESEIDFTNQQPNISSKNIENIELPIPLLEEQKAIVQYIEQETAQINTIIQTIEKEITLVQEYRTALIAEAVTGKIDVRDYEIVETPIVDLYEELEDEMSLAAEDEVEYGIE